MDRSRSSKCLDVIKTQEDIVQYFYNSMLTCIVDKWEEDLRKPTDYMPEPKKTFIYPKKTYVQACDESELASDAVILSAEIEEHIIKCDSRTRGARFLKKTKRLIKSRSGRFSSVSSQSQSGLFEEYPPPPPQPTDFEEFVTIKFKNGNVYSGTVFKKKLHGRGEFRWTDGSTYVGEFVNGDMTGKGKYYYNDESSYEGEVYKGIPHGYGKKFAPDSPNAYCGHWQIGKRHGAGWEIFSENNWYDGNWQSDKMHGKGIRSYSDGSKYQGQFHEGLRQGNGFAILRNNDIYVGEWANGCRSGYGEYIWKAFLNPTFVIPVQNKYVGYWLNNCMHGKGELFFGTKNGARYIGQFIQNFKHGGGIVVCDNGDIIKCDNIFANDKPINFQETGKIDSVLHVSETCLDHCHREFDKLEQGSSSKQTPHMKSAKNLNRNKKTVAIPISEFSKKTKNADLCQFKILPNNSLKSFRVHLNASGEKINLDPFIRRLCDVIYDNKIESKSSIPSKLQPNSWETVGFESESKTQINYNNDEIYHIEEKAMRRTIHIHLRRLREIYKHYSLIGCLKNIPYDTLMNRLFLWQFYKDCKISERGISLTRIDVLLAEDTVAVSGSIHDPFEIIYFWQFLITLIKTAWEVYGLKNSKYVYQGQSILDQIFTKFLNEDIFPNTGHHLGSALFDYKDILPIKATYKWYKSIDEPMSIRTFISNIFSLDIMEIHRYEPIPKDFYVKIGANAAIGNNVVFLEEEEQKNNVGPKKQKIVPYARKCLNKELYFLRELGKNLIYKKIKYVVPGIFLNRECFNHEYQLCFLEFYEIVLICTQHIIKRREIKAKKRATKISEANEVLKSGTIKKSRQYRKSIASHHSMAKRTPAT